MASLENMSAEQRDELAALMSQLAETPETRKDILRLTKKIRPGLTVPELDIEDHTNSALDQMRSENAAIRAELEQRKAVDNLDMKRKSLVKKGLATEDDIPEVEKLMLEKKIADHETAAEYHNWMKQAAKPTPSGYNPSAIRQFDLGKYWKDPRGAAQQEAVKAFQDLRKPTRPIGL
jgi:predicted phage gp36 major capsid-like protein